jgi:hypothetical protein
MHLLVTVVAIGTLLVSLFAARPSREDFDRELDGIIRDAISSSSYRSGGTVTSKMTSLGCKVRTSECVALLKKAYSISNREFVFFSLHNVYGPNASLSCWGAFWHFVCNGTLTLPTLRGFFRSFVGRAPSVEVGGRASRGSVLEPNHCSDVLTRTRYIGFEQSKNNSKKENLSGTWNSTELETDHSLTEEIQSLFEDYAQQLNSSVIPDKHRRIILGDLKRLADSYATCRGWDEVPKGIFEIEEVRKRLLHRRVTYGIT